MTKDFTEEGGSCFIGGKVYTLKELAEMEVPTVPPRKKSDKPSDWLILLSNMKACSYCGTVAGPCLSEENCPNDKGIQDEITTTK